jgi:hypothetical protein
MNPKQFAALLGFLFVAAWAALGFGHSLLCLLGALVFYSAMAFYRNEIDLAELQQRIPRQPVRRTPR